MLLLTPQNFTDYELIDSGDFEKLERWGNYITCRPEPQALWAKRLSQKEWDKKMHVRFVAKSSSSGVWQKNKDMPDRWVIEYNGLRVGSETQSAIDNRQLTIGNEQSAMSNEQSAMSNEQSAIGNVQSAIGNQQSAMSNEQLTIGNRQSAILNPRALSFRLALTSFKHVGLFPEQAVNWDYIYNSIKELKTQEPKFLNLFAYTGAASLAAKAAGADVVHLDSIKQVVTWARENMEHSKLDNIRWVVEDAVAFVKREVKRGKKYHGIILDPPAFGHGPNGENWKLEDMIYNLMRDVATLLDDDEHFLILNTYSLGFSSLIIENIFDDFFPKGNKETGEIFLNSSLGQKLPLGVVGRMKKLIEEKIAD